jgi:hypothetical protein
LAEYIDATATQGTPAFQAGANSINLLIGSLAPGQTVEFVIQVRLSATAAPGSLVTAAASTVQSGLTCRQASGAITITPAGIPVTGIGPGPREIAVMLTALLGLAALLGLGARVVLARR